VTGGDQGALGLAGSLALSIVIPNYNGVALLRENLPSVFDALEGWGGVWEVIIVDDCSSDESCRVIAEEFPRARLLVNPRNLGFSGTCNAGMAAARHPVLVCINTDVKVDHNLPAMLVRHFGDSDLFAVSPRIIVERESKNQGAVRTVFRKGFLKGAFAAAGDALPVRENLYAIGACVAYDAEKFRQLGGYSEIYSPYLFEDVDICYRAWKRGWKSVYEPQATVWHYSNATLAKAKRRLNKKIYFRNRFIFHWSNLSDPSFLARNLLNTLFRLLVSWLWLNFVYYEAFFGALARRREILAVRRAEREHRVFCDAEVLARVG
jgi:GT2 family glycosyltransferase